MADLVFYRLPVPDGSPVTGGWGASYGSGGFHRGIDFGVYEGTPVVNPSTRPATVVGFTNDGSYGQAVCLDHPETPYYSLYAHLSRVDAWPGQTVQPGQQLGLSGNTGTITTGPHLHWQVCTTTSFPIDPQFSRDPLEFLEGDMAEIDELRETVRQLNEAIVNRMQLALVAWGDYDRMMQAYALLKNAGIIQ